MAPLRPRRASLPVRARCTARRRPGTPALAVRTRRRSPAAWQTTATTTIAPPRSRRLPPGTPRVAHRRSPERSAARLPVLGPRRTTRVDGDSDRWSPRAPWCSGGWLHSSGTHLSISPGNEGSNRLGDLRRLGPRDLPASPVDSATEQFAPHGRPLPPKSAIVEVADLEHYGRPGRPSGVDGVPSPGAEGLPPGNGRGGAIRAGQSAERIIAGLDGLGPPPQSEVVVLAHHHRAKGVECLVGTRVLGGAPRDVESGPSLGPASNAVEQ